MKQGTNLCNNLKSIRTRLGMSQQDLANIAGVTRQTISGVESGQYTPNVAITLRLAKALGCKVEDLFWMEEDLPTVEAVVTKTVLTKGKLRVSLARVGGQWIAYPLMGKDAFRTEMIPVDAETIYCNNLDEEAFDQMHTSKILVRVLDDTEKLQNSVSIAGCTPIISLWAKEPERWHPQLRVHYTFANSMDALRSLARGEVHIAGMHLYDSKTQEYNIPFVREVLSDKEAVLISIGVWEEGLLVPLGNPLKIKTIADLVEAKATIVNREIGAGSRMILERQMELEQVPASAVQGFEHTVRSHQDVATAVISGIADAGISTASIAAMFGLGFVPLHSSRYDLVVLNSYLDEPPVQQLLGTLEHRFVKSQLEILGGYDTSSLGEVVASI
ncbi:LOW QUALITY PROTEIN: XRE family transcriptional regulator of molybdate metabolism [Dulcicalothrix desertica PCC 7102]|nr:LOW QUALITY PROTEIN: XRE family transcriptional regulator of molybdate metabolism [Dulcicalothrix desertica PCC 7102]